MTEINSEIAVLVSIKLTGWQGRRKVATVGDELTETKGASKDAADVFVNLVSKEFLAPINQIDREIRAQFYALTFDTGITGVRALPYTVQPLLQQTLADLFESRELATADLLDHYGAERQCRAVSMGRLFNPDHYPEPAAIYASYTANLSLIPMPAAWKLGIDDEDVKRKIDDTRTDIIKWSNADAWLRVYDMANDTLARLERFVPASEGDKARNHFNRSLITSINTLVENMGNMFLGSGHDKDQMETCLEELKTYVGNRDLNRLKTDQRERTATIQATRRVIASIESRPGFAKEDKPAPKVEEKPAPKAIGIKTFTAESLMNNTPAPVVEEAPAIGLYDNLLD